MRQTVVLQEPVRGKPVPRRHIACRFPEPRVAGCADGQRISTLVRPRSSKQPEPAALAIC
jgi:hypothetical protein